MTLVLNLSVRCVSPSDLEFWKANKAISTPSPGREFQILLAGFKLGTEHMETKTVLVGVSIIVSVYAGLCSFTLFSRPRQPTALLASDSPWRMSPIL